MANQFISLTIRISFIISIRPLSLLPPPPPIKMNFCSRAHTIHNSFVYIEHSGAGIFNLFEFMYRRMYYIYIESVYCCRCENVSENVAASQSIHRHFSYVEKTKKTTERTHAHSLTRTHTHPHTSIHKMTNSVDNYYRNIDNSIFL